MLLGTWKTCDGIVTNLLTFRFNFQNFLFLLILILFWFSFSCYRFCYTIEFDCLCMSKKGDSCMLCIQTRHVHTHTLGLVYYRKWIQSDLFKLHIKSQNASLIHFCKSTRYFRFYFSLKYELCDIWPYIYRIQFSKAELNAPISLAHWTVIMKYWRQYWRVSVRTSI